MLELTFAGGRTATETVGVDAVLQADGQELTARKVEATENGARFTYDYEATVELTVTKTARGHELQTTVRAGNQTLTVDALGVKLNRPTSTRLLVDGYHSWDWAGLRDAHQPGSAYWGALWGNPGETGLAVRLRDVPTIGALALNWNGDGNLNALTTGTPYQERNRTGSPTSLGVSLAPGEEFRGEVVAVETPDLANRGGVALPSTPHGEHQPLPRQVGWMTWNIYGRDVSPANVLEGCKLTPSGGLVLLDDGWMPMHGGTPCWGDWYPRESFGASIAQVVQSVEAQDRKLAVWLSPFHVGVHSQLAQDHPEWLLRDVSGGDKLYVDARPGHRNFVLDASLPQVRAHLAEIGSRLGADGVAAIKIDFLYAGAIRGRRADGWTDIAAMRAGVEAIGNAFRTAAGPQSRVYACGASGPSMVGLADANRSGGDAVMGVSSAKDAVPSFGDSSILAQERNLAARSLLWGSTMPPDVDAITFGTVGAKPAMDERAINTWVEICRRAGGPMLDSDFHASVSSQRLQRLAKLNAEVDGKPPVPVRTVDPFAGTPTPGVEDDFFTSGGRALGPWEDSGVDCNSLT